jgi:uncharacterized oligopeptide transporter (OPT) family protein
MGLSWTFHWYYSMLFFLGAAMVWIMERKNKPLIDEFNYPVASGVIAGGSLMGVFIIFWENGPAMISKLLGH